MMDCRDLYQKRRYRATPICGITCRALQGFYRGVWVWLTSVARTRMPAMTPMAMPATKPSGWAMLREEERDFLRLWE